MRRDQLARALLADARHALDVVDAVAHERQHVDDLIGPHAELLDDAGRVEPGALVARVVDADAVADELEEVLVAGDDRDVEALRARACVASVPITSSASKPLERQDGHAERLAGFAHERHLLGEVGRHRRAVRLVVGGELVAERRAGQIERRGDVLRLMIGDELAQHRREAVAPRWWICRRVRSVRESRGRRDTSASCRR